MHATTLAESTSFINEWALNKLCISILTTQTIFLPFRLTFI